MRGDSSPDLRGRGIEAAPIPRALQAADLARELTGDLPCAGCGYNLRSISIRGVCPECGTPVRATILSRIDPYAGVLRPVARPTFTAAGVIVWSMFALIAALLTWYLRAADGWGVVMDRRVPSQRLAVAAACACIVLSAVGATSLVRPHAGIALRRSIAAGAGVLAIIAYAWVYWRIHATFDPRHTKPYFNAEILLTERNWLRLGGSTLLAAAVMLLRPNMRLLASRSLVMRMGRVDRQTLPLLGGVIAISALGDFLHIIAARIAPPPAPPPLVLLYSGLFLISVGSMLLTIGIGGVLIDCIRLVPVILRPPIAMEHVLGASRTQP
jgi:hypothetical protein